METPQPEIVRLRVEGGAEPAVWLSLRKWRGAGRAPGSAATEAAAPAAAAPFLLLHGLASTAAGWDEVARLLAASGRDVFALDFRGPGESDCPDAGYDLAGYAADLRAVIEGLGLRRPIVAGHSLGAMVVLEMLRDAPDAAGAVALIEGGLVDACVQFDTFAECQARVALPPIDGMPRPRVEGYLRSTHPDWSAARLAATMAAFRLGPEGSVTWRLTRPRLDSLVVSMWDQKAPRLWPGVRCPALIVAADTGEARWTEQKRSAAAAAQSCMPDVRVAWLEAPHDVHMDRPEAVGRLLLELSNRAS